MARKYDTAALKDLFGIEDFDRDPEELRLRRRAKSAAYTLKAEKDAEEREKLLATLGTADPRQVKELETIGPTSGADFNTLARLDYDAAKARVDKAERVLRETPTGPAVGNFRRGTHVLPSGEEIPFFTNVPEGQESVGGRGTVEGLTPYFEGTAAAEPKDYDLTTPAGQALQRLKESRAVLRGSPTGVAKEAAKVLPRVRRVEERLGPEAAGPYLGERVAKGQLSMDALSLVGRQRKEEKLTDLEREKIKLVRELESRSQSEGAIAVLTDMENRLLKGGRGKVGISAQALNVARQQVSQRGKPRNTGDLGIRALITAGVYLPLEPEAGKQPVGGNLPTASALDTATQEQEAMVQGLQAASGESVSPEGPKPADLAHGEGYGYGEPGVMGATKDVAAFYGPKMPGFALTALLTRGLGMGAVRGIASKIGKLASGTVVRGRGAAAIEELFRGRGPKAAESVISTMKGLGKSALRRKKAVAKGLPNIARLAEGLRTSEAVGRAAQTAEGLRTAKQAGEFGKIVAGTEAAKGVKAWGRVAPEVMEEQIKAFVKGAAKKQDIRNLMRKYLRTAEASKTGQYTKAEVEKLFALLRGEL